MIVTHMVGGAHEDWWDSTVAEVVPAGTGDIPADLGPLLKLHDTRTPHALIPASRVERWHDGPCLPFPALCHAGERPGGGGA